MSSHSEPLLSSPTKRTCSPLLLTTLSLATATLLCLTAFLHITPSIHQLDHPQPSDLCSRSPNLPSCLAVVSDAVARTPRPSAAEVFDVLLLKSNLQLYAAVAAAKSVRGRINEAGQQSALDDCLELFDLSLHHLAAARGHADSRTWLSAVLTNHVTCLDELNGTARSTMAAHLEDLTALASASLAVLSALSPSSTEGSFVIDFPRWISHRDRKLLEASSAAAVQANAVVAQDGTGNFNTVQAAVDASPDKGNTRYVIYIKTGVYNETVRIGKKKTNLMLAGDGTDATVITGSLNNIDGTTTFNSATLVMAGPGSGRRHSDRLQQQPDDAPGTSQHSSPGPQDGSEQASTSGAKQKKRGPYMGFNLMRLIGAGGSGDGKVKIHFAPGTMKPAGGKADGSLPREIGLIARTEIPLHFKSWSKVTPPTRAQLMERVKAKFTSDAPPEVFEKYCLETFKARFKEHRGELSKHFKKFASEEEARENPPPGVSIDDWVMLCTRFTAESFKALSTTNTGSRSKLRWNHLAGTKSFVAHRASLSAIPDAAGSSREIGEIELFQHTHMYPGGAWIAPEAEQSHASMLHMREQYQQTQAALEASGGETQPVSEAEICSQVVGDRYLQSLGQSRSRARSRRSSAQHDRALEDQVRALEQDLIREREERDRDRAERDWERERDRAENERRFSDIKRMFSMAGGRPPVPGVGMPPAEGPPGGWPVGGMPQGGQSGGDPSGGYGYYNMYPPWVMPPRGPPGDQSGGGWRWTAPGDQGGGSS